MEGYGITKDAETTSDVAMDPVRMYGTMHRRYLIFSLHWREACGIRSFVKVRIQKATKHSVLFCPYGKRTMDFTPQLMVNLEAL